MYTETEFLRLSSEISAQVSGGSDPSDVIILVVGNADGLTTNERLEITRRLRGLHGLSTETILDEKVRFQPKRQSWIKEYYGN